MDAVELAERIARLPCDERAILETLLDRLEQGQDEYGRWDVEDRRDYGEEAFTEIIDGLHYCAAGLVRIRRRGDR